MLLALDFNSETRKHILGIRERSTAKTKVLRTLLSDLIERGPDADVPRLWVIGGAKALWRAITVTFGASALAQCVRRDFDVQSKVAQYAQHGAVTRPPSNTARDTVRNIASGQLYVKYFIIMLVSLCTYY